MRGKLVDEAEIVVRFYDAAFDAVRFRDALRRLAQFGGGIGGGFLLWDKQAAEPALIAHAGHMGEDAADVYRRHFASIDPYRPLIEVMAPNKWTQCVHHFDDAFVSKSPWFNEYLIPRGVRHFASARIGTDAQFDAFLSIHRGPDEEPFSADELQRFERVGSHLANAIKVYLEVTRTSLGRAAAAALPHQLSPPAVLVDASARVLLANSAAEALLAREATLGIRRSRLTPARNDDERRLSRLIGVAATTGVGGEMLIQRQVGQPPMSLLVTPAGSVTTVYDLVPVSAALVLLQDLVPRRTRPPKGLRLRFGLTDAEVQLAEALLDGQRLSTIAANRHVSVETVRTQLQSLFKKTGTTRQADLIRVLLAPPVGSLERDD